MQEGLIIPLAAIGMPLVLVPTILTMKFRQKKREWIHRERMQAMQAGLPVPPIDCRSGSGAVIAIGAGVPAASVLAAWLTSVSLPLSFDDSLPIVAVVWGCAWLLSTCALITALVLGIVHSRARRSDPIYEPTFADKTAYDPDAFDVVSRRG